MKKKLLTIAIASAFALIPSIVSGADESVSIKDAFTDEAFQNYVSTNFDKDKDGYLSSEEIVTVTSLDFWDYDSFKSFEGIENFTELKTFSLQYADNIRFLNLSENKKLQSIFLNYNGKLEHIDLKDLNKLETLTVNNHQNLKTLDVSGLEELTTLEANNNAIKDIKFGFNSNLDTVKLVNNKFTTIDMDGAPTLKSLFINDNLLTSFALKGNKDLKELYIFNNPSLTTIDINDATDLQYLDFRNTKVDNIDLYNNTYLLLAAKDEEPEHFELEQYAIYEYKDTNNTFTIYCPDTAFFTTVAPTNTPTPEPTATETPVPTVTATPEPTEAVEPTTVAEPTTAAEPTTVAEPTTAAEPTATVAPTVTVEPTATPAATATATPAPTTTVTATPTVTAAPTTEATVTPAATEDKDVATVGGNTYKINGKNVTVTAAKNGKIPATVKINGKKYKVTEIASKVFKKKTKLATITIGKNVVKIQANAFANVTGVKKIDVKSTVLKSVNKTAFKGISKKVTVKLPAKKAKAYKKLFKKALKGIKVSYK